MGVQLCRVSGLFSRVLRAKSARVSASALCSALDGAFVGSSPGSRASGLVSPRLML